MEDVSPGGTPSPEPSSTPAATPATPDAALDQAYAAGVSADPVSDSPAPSVGEAPTTVEPVPVEPPLPGPGEKKGPIPFEVHETALKNARQKASEEREAALMAQLQQELQPLRDHILLAQSLQTDRAGTIARLLEESRDDAAVTATVARMLAGRRGKAQPDATADPEPPRFGEGENGTLMFDPALDKSWREWNDRQIERRVLARMEEQYGPIKQSYEETRKRQEAEQKWTQYTSEVDALSKQRGEEWDAMPFMEKDANGPSPTRTAILKRQGELHTELLAKVKAGEVKIRPSDLPWVALQRAYREIAQSQGIPALQAKTEQAFVTSAVQKSRGGQPDPVASAPAQPRRARTPDEALEQVFASARR